MGNPAVPADYDVYIVTVPAATLNEWLVVFGDKTVYVGCEVYAYEVMNGERHSPKGYKYSNFGTDDDPWLASYFDGGLFDFLPDIPSGDPQNP